MEATMERVGEIAEIVVSGELTIGGNDTLAGLLRTALEEAGSVRVTLKEVSEMDVSFLQLLCSAHRTAVRLAKDLTVGDDEGGFFKRITNEAGLKRHRGCVANPTENCLWVGGDKR